MAITCTLSEAVGNLIHDGDVVAMELAKQATKQATKQARSAHAES